MAEPPPVVERLNACRCTAWVGSSDHRMLDPDPEPDEPRFPWKCGGYPAIVLPYALDGLMLSEDTDFGALLRKTTLGWAPGGGSAFRAGGGRGMGLQAVRSLGRYGLGGPRFAGRVGSAVRQKRQGAQWCRRLL